jgi:hypothetical protein
MKNADKQAYPRTGYEHSNDATQSHYYHEDGLTKREYFAAMAMQGILAGIPQREQDMVPLLRYYAKQFPDKTMNECVAIEAVEMADKLLKQLES